MGNRKALLIGAADYGSGFSPLPAVRNDIELMGKALKRCGYDITIVPDETVKSTTGLRDEMQSFCEQCLQNDVHIIYFSGHGMILDDQDCIIPAGADLKKVRVREDWRIKTDLTPWLRSDNNGLVIFIIDACRSRDHDPVTKSAVRWGERPADDLAEKFVRFYGCSAGQVCRVLEHGLDGKPVSLFSKALSDALNEGGSETLSKLSKNVLNRFKDLTEEKQTPRLNQGEQSGSGLSLSDLPIFEAVVDTQKGFGLWEEFDPSKLHCLVITSERESGRRLSLTLKDLVRSAMIVEGSSRIWEKFQKSQNESLLVSGRRRNLPEKWDDSRLRLAAVTINDALDSSAALGRTIRALIEADLAVIDLTGFEPGMMLLLGVRAACRRGVTQCSHGGGWTDDKPLELPFNLQDLSVGSHTPGQTREGDDPVVDRFVKRAINGFDQLAKQPRYLDLPAFEALRQLGPQPDASSTIWPSKQILMLCPYEEKFFSSWTTISRGLKEALATNHKLKPKIVRVIDLDSPQLVSQSIYEQSRRTAGCVADWSGCSPSVFLELGVRLAVSEWGAVSILDPGFADKSDDPLAKERESLKQVEQLRALFKPLPYSSEGTPLDFKAAARLLARNDPRSGTREETTALHEIAWQTISTVQQGWPEVFDELGSTANSLSHFDREKRLAPQILFNESPELKDNSERAALERRIAAWLYLDKRVGIKKLSTDGTAARAYLELGQAAAATLYDQADDLDLAGHIYSVLQAFEGTQKPSISEQVKNLQRLAQLDRKKGDALQKAARDVESRDAFAAGVAKLEKCLNILDGLKSDQLSDLPAQRAETLGSLGGLLRRIGDNQGALKRYIEGAQIESAFGLTNTYNRVNRLKYALRTGLSTLDDLTSEIRKTTDFLREMLNNPQTQGLSDSAWSWADLGDCHALLGELDAAETAYSTFIQKADIKSPATTLDVLRSIATALQNHDDPGKDRVHKVVEALEARLNVK